MRVRVWLLMMLGVVAALLGIALGSLVAVAIDPAYAPIEVVSASAIDLPPAPVKEWATATFGTNAKYVVIGTVAVAVLILAALAGVLAGRRRWLGAVLMLVIGGIGAVAGLRRPTGEIEAIVPSLVAGIAAAGALLAGAWFSKGGQHPSLPVPARDEQIVPEQEALQGETAPSQPLSTRRAVLAGGAGIVAAAALMGLARSLAERGSAVASRVAALLPRPTEALPPLPASVQAPVPGLAPFVTPNDDFYRIDTAVVVPQVKAPEWSLTIDGLVDSPLTLTYDQLIELPMVERDITIMCVSNPVGGPYIGNARWLGTPLMPLLEEAGIRSGADQLLSQSIDGWTCSTPIDGLAEREPLLAIGMNGEPLPIDHGFPVRMIVPGLYGFISATKWVTRISATTYADAPAYWTVRGWATDAPVLTGSRIDLPRPEVTAGSQAIAGVAWAMNGNGVSRVEVQVDNGPWIEANLADEPTAVTWRQWWMPWDATAGEHQIRVRATNGRGEVQSGEPRESFPSGATGYDTRIISVA